MNRSLLAVPMVLIAASLFVGCERKTDQPPAYAQGGYQQPGGGYQQPGGGYQQPGQPAPGGYQPQPAPGGGTQPQPAPGGGTQPQPAPGGGGSPFPFPIPGFPGGGGGTQPAPGGSSQPQGGGGSPFPFPIPGFPGGGGGGGGQPAPSGGGGGSAQPLDPNLAQAAMVGIYPLEAQHARGMQKVGAPIAGNFQQGQSLSQDFQLQPNKCYTVLANSQGITELDAQIQVVTPMGAQAAASDNTTGASAILGGGGQCWTYQVPLAATGRMVITARTGAGLAAAQLYMK